MLTVYFFIKPRGLRRLKVEKAFVRGIYKQRGAFPLSFIGSVKREEKFLSISMSHLSIFVQPDDSRGAKLWNLSRILPGLTDIPVSFARPVPNTPSRMLS
jgi:hypothetical protein